jgi:hypothetical protein
VSDFLDNYPDALIKDLLWCRNYHLMIIRDIEDKLRELSKKHGGIIILDCFDEGKRKQ